MANDRPYTEADVERVAEATYRQWHGRASAPFADQAADVRDEYAAGARAALKALAAAGRLADERALRRAATNGAVWALKQAARLCPHSGLVPAAAIEAMAEELLYAERIVPAEVATDTSSPAPLADTGTDPDTTNDAPAGDVTEIKSSDEGGGADA